MIFLLTIIAGGIAAWLGRRAGFITMWVLLFNLVVAIFTALLLTPTLLAYVPFLRTSTYYQALCLLVLSLLVFLVLHNMANMFLVRAFSAEVPKLFNTLLAAVLGFFVGHFAAGFIIFIFAVTPIAQAQFFDYIIEEGPLSQTVKTPVMGAAGLTAALSFQGEKDTSEKVFNWFCGLEEEPVSTPPTPGKPAPESTPGDSPSDPNTPEV